MVGLGAFLQSVIFIRGNGFLISNGGIISRVVGWTAMEGSLGVSRPLLVNIQLFSCSARPNKLLLRAKAIASVNPWICWNR